MEVLNKDSIIDALKDVYDPEIPVNVVDLGLIYNVEVEDNEVHVEMTLTAQGCGMGPYIAVSYTHLRAHETKANGVCRVLL